MLQLRWIRTLVWNLKFFNDFLGRISVTNQELIKEEEEDRGQEATAEEMTTVETIASEETEIEDPAVMEAEEMTEETEEDMIEETTEEITTEETEDTDDTL